MRFDELAIGDTFDFVTPAWEWYVLPPRCTKLSARRYRVQDRYGEVVRELRQARTRVYHVVPTPTPGREGEDDERG